MQVNISDSLNEYLQSVVAQSGFANVSDYLETLVEADRSERERLSAYASDHRDRLQELALEGIESGDAGPMTKERWDELKRPYEQRLHSPKTQ